MIALTQSEEIELMNELAAKLEEANRKVNIHQRALTGGLTETTCQITRRIAQKSLREFRTVLQALGDQAP